MKGIDSVQAAERRPIQDSRIKREARRLADWTGISLSESQEITARAYGATSWQALKLEPTFVPDEHLGPWRVDKEPRYHAIRDMLAERLRVCTSQALLLATAWQPTALCPDPLLWMAAVRGSGSEDWKLLHDFGSHSLLGSDTHVLLACRNSSRLSGSLGSDAPLTLVATRRSKLARFIAEADVTELILSPPLARFMDGLNADLFGGSATKRQLAALTRRVHSPNSLSMPSDRIGAVAAPSRLQARWLTCPLTSEDIESEFAAKMPWMQSEFPGLMKSHTTHFWAMQTDRLCVLGLVRNGHVSFQIRVSGSGGVPHSEADAGVGGLRYLVPRPQPESGMHLYDVDEPGFYFVKYEIQPRSHNPIPYMDEDLAQRIRDATGLSNEFAQPIGGYAFYCSPAGLALAKWAATFPTRAKTNRGFNAYTQDWLEIVRLRMEFELVRGGALN